MSKLQHLAEIMIVLQYKNYVTAAELAEVLGVDKKTIYRYIDTLIETKVPIETRKGRNGGFFLDGNFHMKESALDNRELDALLMASHILTKEVGFAYEHQLKSAVTKIKNTAGLKESNSFKIDDIQGIDTLDDNLSKAGAAIENGRSIEINYLSVNRDELKEVLVDPYSVIYRGAQWHLIGFNHGSDTVQSFPIKRITNINATNYIFIKPVDFSIEKFIKESLGVFYGDKIKVTIAFKEHLRKLIESCKWHAAQEIQYLEEGRVVLSIYVDELEELKKWILSFGAAAEVLAPLQLRGKIKKELIELKAIYEDS